MKHVKQNSFLFVLWKDRGVLTVCSSFPFLPFANSECHFDHLCALCELLRFSSVTVQAEKVDEVVNTFHYGEWTITIPVFLEQKPVPSGRQCFPSFELSRTISANSRLSSANLILSHENGNQPCYFLIHFCWELEQNGNISSLKLAGTATRQSVRDDNNNLFLFPFNDTANIQNGSVGQNPSVFLIIHEFMWSNILLYLKDEKGVRLNLNITLFCYSYSCREPRSIIHSTK